MFIYIYVYIQICICTVRCVCHTMYGKIREQRAHYKTIKTLKLMHIRVNLSIYIYDNRHFSLTRAALENNLRAFSIATGPRNNYVQGNLVEGVICAATSSSQRQPQSYFAS